MTESEPFPEIITGLPQAGDAEDGVRTHFVQGEGQQVAFVAFEVDVDAPEESHPAQWVAVVAGEVELTMAGETTVYRRGDCYFVLAGIRHSARIRKGSRLLELFDQPDRFRRR
jgi:quercetin dioxygenase-like cupin family protein